MNATGAETHGFDFYYRWTDKNGKSVVRETRVWGKQVFIDARNAEAKKEGGKAAFEQITPEQYRKER